VFLTDKVFFYFLSPHPNCNIADIPSGIAADLRKLRDDLCLTGEESLNWGDFVAQMFDKQLVMKEDNLRMVFEHFKQSDPLSDPDNIVVSDVVNILGVSEKQAMEIMSSAIGSNGNCDGKINFADFRRMMETQEEDE